MPAPPGIRVDSTEILDAFRAARGLRRFLYRTDEGALVAWGAHEVVASQGPARFQSAKRQIHGGLWVGGFSFSSTTSPGWDDLGAMQWWRPAESAWFGSWNARGGTDRTRPTSRPPSPVKQPDSVAAEHRLSPPASPVVADRDAWDDSVAKARQCIQAGQAEKLVLARCEAAPCNDVEQVVKRLLATRMTVYAVEVEPGWAIVGATPEKLLAIDGPALRTHALAGTRLPGHTSQKLIREHDVVRRHIVDALTGLGLGVEVQDVGTRRAADLEHLESKIQATGRVEILDAAEALHPTPAVGAYPATAVPLVSACDGLERGWYGGCVGFMRSPNHGELAVALRCARLTPHGAWRFAGAGIVADSSAETEWQETEAKLAVMREAMR